jgi:hypothetical protein
MRWLPLALLGGVLAQATPVRADVLPQFLEVPATYTPGLPFSFEVRIPNVSDFSSYTIEIGFETGVVDPDILAFAITDPAQYPYPTTAGFSSSFFAEAGTPTAFLTISDSTNPGVETWEGLNDLVATVTVVPGPRLVGAILLFVGSNTEIAINQERTPQITFPAPIWIDQAEAPPVAPVPTPAGLISLGTAFLLLLTWDRVRRARQVYQSARVSGN